MLSRKDYKAENRSQMRKFFLPKIHRHSAKAPLLPLQLGTPKQSSSFSRFLSHFPFLVRSKLSISKGVDGVKIHRPSPHRPSSAVEHRNDVRTLQPIGRVLRLLTLRNYERSRVVVVPPRASLVVEPRCLKPPVRLEKVCRAGQPRVGSQTVTRIGDVILVPSAIGNLVALARSQLSGLFFPGCSTSV